jgi:hypothetical protein
MHISLGFCFLTQPDERKYVFAQVLDDCGQVRAAVTLRQVLVESGKEEEYMVLQRLYVCVCTRRVFM